MTDPGYGRYLFSAAQNYQDRQLKERELELMEDKWGTEKRGIDYDFDTKSKTDAAVSETYANIMDNIAAEQAYTKRKEDWEKEMWGSYAKIGEGKGLGTVISDQIVQRYSPYWLDKWESWGFGGGSQKYEDLYPEGPRYKKHDKKALLDLIQNQKLSPEMINFIAQAQGLDPAYEGSQEGLMQMLTMPGGSQ